MLDVKRKNKSVSVFCVVVVDICLDRLLERTLALILSDGQVTREAAMERSVRLSTTF